MFRSTFRHTRERMASCSLGSTHVGSRSRSRDRRRDRDRGRDRDRKRSSKGGGSEDEEDLDEEIKRRERERAATSGTDYASGKVLGFHDEWHRGK